MNALRDDVRKTRRAALQTLEQAVKRRFASGPTREYYLALVRNMFAPPDKDKRK